jgi:hypothetical protein
VGEAFDSITGRKEKEEQEGKKKRTITNYILTQF